MDGLKEIKLPGALVIVAAFATIFGLVTWGHQDLKDISIFLGGCSAAYIAWRQATAAKVTDRIEANTNGTNEALRNELRFKDAQMLALVQDHAKQIAQVVAQTPPGTPLPQSLADNQTG